jgi:hypothetical protein
MGRSNRSRRLLALSVFIAAGGWLFLRGEPAAPPASEPETEIAAAAPVVQPQPRPVPAPVLLAVAPPPATEPVGDDGLPIMPARADDPRPEGPVHPHPLTPAHERIFRENRLIGALDGAMDVRDVPALRRLLAEYRDQYPEDAYMLQDGYQVIADCLEHPGEDARAAARRFSEEQRGSTLRRFVERHCL